MKFSRLLDITPTTNLRQRIWIALAAGGVFGVLTGGGLLALSFFSTKKLSIEFVIAVLCLVMPLVFIVTVGTFTQLTYQVMFVRWGKQMRDAKKSPSDGEQDS